MKVKGRWNFFRIDCVAEILLRHLRSPETARKSTGLFHLPCAAQIGVDSPSNGSNHFKPVIWQEMRIFDAQ
jgi:hypothetical protein